jgi:GAF domain-containing protein
MGPLTRGFAGIQREKEAPLMADQTPATDPFAAARRRLEELWARRPERDEALRATVAILHEEMPDYHWVGIYLVEGEELVIHNYRGRPTPHERIPIGQGICGAAISENDTVIVDDVKEDARYLACSLETSSEIVVPIHAAGKPVGEIDIDSDLRAAFSDADRRFLEEIARRLSTFLDS